MNKAEIKKFLKAGTTEFSVVPKAAGEHISQETFSHGRVWGAKGQRAELLDIDATWQKRTRIGGTWSRTYENRPAQGYLVRFFESGEEMVVEGKAFRRTWEYEVAQRAEVQAMQEREQDYASRLEAAMKTLDLPGRQTSSRHGAFAQVNLVDLEQLAAEVAKLRKRSEGLANLEKGAGIA